MENEARRLIESAVRRLSNSEVRKERDYKRLAQDIVEAVGAKIQETGKHEFKIPSDSNLIKGGRAKCGTWTSMGVDREREVIIIEESETVGMKAERGITVISERFDDFPFVQFTEKITQGTDTEKAIYADKDTKFDLRPIMLRFLEDIEKWEAVA